MINVLIIEDHEMVRQGTERMLSEVKGIHVVGSANTGKEGLELARKMNPNVVILDFQLQDTNGLELTRKLLRYDPDVKILIVSALKNDLISAQLLEAGIAGYVSKESQFNEVEKAVLAVHHGQRYLSADIASQLALGKTTGLKSPFQELSAREMEIVLLLVNGKNIDLIAKQLHIAKKTVHTYRYRIFEKLNIKTDLELLKMALQANIVQVNSDAA